MRASVGKFEGNTAQQMLVTGKKKKLQQVHRTEFPSIRGPALVETGSQLRLLQWDCFQKDVKTLEPSVLGSFAVRKFCF